MKNQIFMYNPLPDYLQLQPSAIHGYGVFTTKDIPKDTILGISHVHHDLFPDGWIRTPLGGYYNHSETPNCKLVANNMDEGFLTAIKLLRTIKYIKVGTELTCTYTIWKFEEEYHDVASKESWLGL